MLLAFPTIKLYSVEKEGLWVEKAVVQSEHDR